MNSNLLNTPYLRNTLTRRIVLTEIFHPNVLDSDLVIQQRSNNFWKIQTFDRFKSGMSKMRIGQPQPQPQHNQPVKNDHNHNHNHNLTKSHTPTTTSTQFFYDKTPQPQPQPNFFQGKHHNPTTTQFFFQNHPNLLFYHNFTTKLG